MNMNKTLVRSVGGRVINKQLAKHSRTGGALDIKLGFALLRDRRVPFGVKFLSLLLGGALTWGLMYLELPLEGAIAVLLPVFGLAADALIDGAEFVIGPFLIASLLLPRIAPREIVDEVRMERDNRLLNAR